MSISDAASLDLVLDQSTAAAAADGIDGDFINVMFFLGEKERGAWCFKLCFGRFLLNAF